MSLDAQRNGQVHGSRETAFWSRIMGLASVLSVVPACRQVRVYVTLRLSHATSPLVQGGWGRVWLHLASIRVHPLPSRVLVGIPNLR